MEFIKSNTDLVDNQRSEETENGDPVLNALKKKAGSTGDYNVTRWLSDRSFAGTNTKQEIIELDRQLIKMINEKMFGYKYIEEYLSTVGYQKALIRARFKVLTGADYEDFMPYAKFLKTPPTIPGINYGWGVSKDSKYEHYFIQPYYLGYSIWGQKGYLDRKEVNAFLTLELAQKAMEKLVKEFIYYDVIVDVPATQKPVLLTEPVGTYERGQRKQEQQDIAMKKAMLEIQADSDADEEPSPEETAKKEETMEEADKRKQIPFDSIRKELTPHDMFENEKQEVSGDIVPKTIKKVVDYIKAKDEAITAYVVTIDSFKYKQEELESIIKNVTPAIEEEKVEEYFTSNAVITVVINIQNKKASTGNMKQGYMVFTVFNGDVVSDDTFKGEDDKIYGLTEAGLDQYFSIR